MQIEKNTVDQKHETQRRRHRPETEMRILKGTPQTCKRNLEIKSNVQGDQRRSSMTTISTTTYRSGQRASTETTNPEQSPAQRNKGAPHLTT